MVKVLEMYLFKKFNNANFRSKAARGCTPTSAVVGTIPGL